MTHGCRLWPGRALISAGLGLLLTACNPVLKGVGDGLLLATGVGQPRLEAQAVNPQAGYLKVESGPEALMVLGYREHGREVWYGAGPVALTLRQGVVVRASGLDRDLTRDEWQAAGADYLRRGLHTLPAGQAVPLLRVRSLAGGWQHHRQRYDLVAVGLEAVTVWNGESRELLRVEERPVGASHGRRWPGAVYWVAPDNGAMVASQQWLSPERRFALVSREPQALLPEDQSQTVDQVQVAGEAQRLSQVLRQHPGLQQGSAVAVFSRHRLPASTRQWREVLVDLRLAEATAAPGVAAALSRWHALLEARAPAGRWPLTRDDAYWLAAAPAHDPVLAVGDRVQSMAVMAPVTLLTADGRACTQPFRADWQAEDYLRPCDQATPDVMALVQALGDAHVLRLGRWNRMPAPAVTPGAVLAVPPRSDLLALATAAAQSWWQGAAP